MVHSDAPTTTTNALTTSKLTTTFKPLAKIDVAKNNLATGTNTLRLAPHSLRNPPPSKEDFVSA